MQYIKGKYYPQNGDAILTTHMRRLALFIVMILPNFLKIILYRKIFRWKIGEKVHIGISFIDAKDVVLKDNARIGNLTLIKNMRKLELGRNTVIGNINRINGSLRNNWAGELIMGNNSSITSSHFIDAGGGVYIGDSVTIGGIHCEVWSHEISFSQGIVIPKSTRIGTNVYIASSAKLAPGANIPSYCVVGLGTVVPKKFACDEFNIIVGDPAIAKKMKISSVQKMLNV